MIEKNTLFMPTALHGGIAAGMTDTVYKPVAACAPTILSDKTFVSAGSLIALIGIGLVTGVCYAQPEPLATAWGYPSMLLGALTTIAGTLMIARGVSRQSLLDDTTAD